ncbi:hypothetical protein PPL_12409 [Heterostelium album PN500]|uniref:Uncharacterized protein n=1 Tax=Heterostelium pallidum (strain ATCC 26659 / Pp 5 / PN500) TaxID=670386 RepID=D3BMI9_HETP5|nr:hypothetical protein PPL_12409 [Heterostelium album PN500]EFA77201.1 hypothetical protein PPL_12409 [Heterostelium album PN500]|eukprot:XP_020429330.1 hypothetical protein PPL_12409 [Heterostelium album PN500]
MNEYRCPSREDWVTLANIFSLEYESCSINENKDYKKLMHKFSEDSPAIRYSKQFSIDPNNIIKCLKLPKTRSLLMLVKKPNDQINILQLNNLYEELNTSLSNPHPKRKSKQELINAKRKHRHTITELQQQQLNNKDHTITELQQQLNNKDHAMAELKQQLNNKDQQIESLNNKVHTVTEQQQQLNIKDQQIESLNIELNNLRQKYQELSQHFEDFRDSVEGYIARDIDMKFSNNPGKVKAVVVEPTKERDELVVKIETLLKKSPGLKDTIFYSLLSDQIDTLISKRGTWSVNTSICTDAEASWKEAN